MKRVGRLVIVLMTVLALAFPASANAWPGEGIVKGAWSGAGEAWEGFKDGLGWGLEKGYGVLEVGWEGIYGAGCGVKNLATWNGSSCSASVSKAGDDFRSLIHDVDECAAGGIAAANPAGWAAISAMLFSFAASETKSPGDKDKIGMTPGEAKTVIKKAAAAGTSNPAVTNWLKSTGGIKAIANNPIWTKVPKAMPLVDKLFIVHKIATSCGRALEFVTYGGQYLLTGQEVWKQDDNGTWLHCTIKCVPDPELNYPGCDPIFAKTENPDDGIEEELVCYPGTGDPGPKRPPPTKDEAARKAACPPVISQAGSNFDFDAYCDERVREANVACANGTAKYPISEHCGAYRGQVSQGPTATVSASGPRASRGLNAANVPGGSISGSCETVIRDVAANGGGGAHSAADKARCLGTSDFDCQKLRAQAAAGAAVFPLDPKIQRRCFS